ncbi:MAG TPA: aldehyde ferredoxin oxidoreductase family protein [Anaerolineae bacterium]|nr:aldehyde ferredoxin oxidoreductase family protein [Anaerolineae bacterium]
MGLTAWIDLTTGEERRAPTDPALAHRFLGGRGLGAALLARHQAGDERPRDGDPFHPQRPLIFSAGPLAGTGWPAGARTHVTFHSPLTGVYGYANSGGFFGPALARAGYDALVISGRAEQPVYLEVTPQGIALRPADHLWGQGVHATHDALAAGGGRVACIGPAGENRVRIAAILNDRARAAARCGGGSVMGSKNLKAVVVRGEVAQALPPAFREQARQAMRQVRDHPNVAGLREWGTVHLVAIKNQVGDLPAHNHQQGQVPWAGRLDAEAIARYTVKTEGCYACPIRCGRVTEVVQGPEYETLDALGPMCGVDDPEVVLEANRLCNDLGLDTISTGVAIAFAMECHQRGLLDDELSLEWGDPATLLGLIERIALRQGLGNLLAEGVRHAAQAIGGDASRYALHVKGMELPRQEPRITKGFGLGHTTSNRGADHLYALPTIDLAGNLEAARRLFPPGIIPALMDVDDETYKPDLVIQSEHICAVSDALGICKFTTTETYALYPEDLAAGLGALWGRQVDAEELLTAGERIVNLERMYNVRLGLSRADDRLPTRFTDEPLEVYRFDGETAVPVHVGLVRDLDAMLDRYYRLRGWDENGIPTPETLARLGLNDWS